MSHQEQQQIESHLENEFDDFDTIKNSSTQFFDEYPQENEEYNSEQYDGSNLEY